MEKAFLRYFFLKKSHFKKRTKGQMAIFIALIFQVLFVFFSMSINIALMVHDKINLQNAVDLAAYYAAQKQAELLNVIAHQNYQIRRAWKLLTWRYRVIGTLGIKNPEHPGRAPFNPLNSRDTRFNNPFPTICTNHTFRTGIQGQNLCKLRVNQLPALPIVPVIMPLGFNISLQQFSIRARQGMGVNCDNLVAYNWWFALNIFNSYRFEQAERRALIKIIAQNLGMGGSQFLDLSGQSVQEGARKVFQKNLSFSNASAIQSFEFFNSLSGQRPSDWLPEIYIWPILLYSTAPPGVDCNITSDWIGNKPQRNPNHPLLQNNQVQFLENLTKQIPPKKLRMTLGVEKNPWFLAYAGIRAQTRPRPIFWPMGPSITLKAKAFAKPFGGRIGPWHYKNWPQGSLKSTGGSKTDSLLPDRFVAGRGNMNPNNMNQQRARLPNYSRYPGDRLGLESRLGMVGVANAQQWRTREMKYDFNYFNQVAVYHPTSNRSFDRLAWNSIINRAPKYRKYELAAIAPDLFDITYYSTALNADVYYKALRNYWGSFAPIKPDLGVRVPTSGNLPSPYGSSAISLKGQMKKIRTLNLRHPMAYWFIKKPSHLLTAWTSSNVALDFTTFPNNRFGRCGLFDDSNRSAPRIPNSCVALGGRSGYSVKLISKDFLLSSEYEVGSSSGQIKNPPLNF